MIMGLFRRNPQKIAMDALCRIVSDASRIPSLYRDHGVPDTVEGRFESMTLHAILVLRALKDQPEHGRDAAQDFVDAVFRFLDIALRDLNVSDVAVGKKIKKLAKSFYARVAAYDEGLATPSPALEDALRRNILEGEGDSRTLAAYVRASATQLAARNLAELMAGEGLFPDPTTFVEEPR
jgi:cytochrome b pre-mRNA-processing protein 3